jgi:hypothetical protein
MDKHKLTFEERKEAAGLCVDLSKALLDESLALEYFADNVSEMRKIIFMEEAAQLVEEAHSRMHEYEQILTGQNAELCETAIEHYRENIKRSQQNTASTKRCTLNTRPSV